MENDNYADTFKGKESSSTPNVFSQHLGQTGGYSSYGYTGYDEPRREYIREDVNKEEEDLNRENETDLPIGSNVNNLEIFEDKNNHIEELNDLNENDEENLDNIENDNEIMNNENFDNDNERNYIEN
jgi:hypothetical protein